MKEKIINSIFSLTGASITIGVVGFMSGIVTIFVNVNEQVSIKWLLFSVLVSVSLILIFLKIIYDQSREIMPPPPFEHPIKYVPEEQVFVIRRNEHFLNNIVVGCYSQRDEIDRLAYLGVVHLLQDKVIQIKIRSDFKVLESIPTAHEELKSIVIRPVVPMTAFERISTSEN